MRKLTAITKTTIVIIVIVLIAFIGLYGLYIWRTTQVTPSATTITVYAEGRQDSWNEILSYFKSKYPQIKDYTLYVESAGKIMQRFLSEESAGKHIADVVIMQTVGIETAMKNGLLMYYIPSTANDIVNSPIVSRFIKTGYAYPYRVLVQGIGINTEALKQLGIDPNAINSYKDLTKPGVIEKLIGRVGMADPRYTVSIELYYFMNATYGPDFWKSIAQLKPIWEPKSNVAIDDLIKGKIAVLIGALDYWFSEPAGPIKFIYPEEGVVIKPISEVKAVPQNYTAYYAIDSSIILQHWAKIFGIAG